MAALLLTPFGKCDGCLYFVDFGRKVVAATHSLSRSDTGFGRQGIEGNGLGLRTRCQSGSGHPGQIFYLTGR